MTNDPELLESLKQLFLTRNDLNTIVEHQQRLFKSLQDLEGRVRKLESQR